MINSPPISHVHHKSSGTSNEKNWEIPRDPRKSAIYANSVWISAERNHLRLGRHAIGDARGGGRSCDGWMGTNIEAFFLSAVGKRKVEVPFVWQQTKNWFGQRRGRWWSAVKARRTLLLIISSGYSAWEIIASISLPFRLFIKNLNYSFFVVGFNGLHNCLPYLIYHLFEKAPLHHLTTYLAHQGFYLYDGMAPVSVKYILQNHSS